jgi:hypothetical protein
MLLFVSAAQITGGWGGYLLLLSWLQGRGEVVVGGRGGLAVKKGLGTRHYPIGMG